MTIISSSKSTVYTPLQPTEIRKYDSDKRLNAWLPLCTLSGVEGWTEESFSATHWYATKNERAKLVKEKICNIYEALARFRDKHHKNLDSCVKSIGHTMDAKSYLFYCIREVVKELALNMNDDVELYEKLDGFRQDYVQIRYNSGDHDENVERCKTFIAELIESFSSIGQKSYARELKPYLSLCSDLLDCNDLLEASLGSLFSKNNIQRQRLSLEMLAEGYFYAAQQIQVESERVLTQIINELEPFLGKAEHPLQYAEKLNIFLVEKKQEIQQLSIELCTRDPQKIAENYSKFIEFSKAVFGLTSGFDLGLSDPTLGWNQRHLNIFKGLLVHAKEVVDDESELVDWDHLLIIDFGASLGVPLGKHTIADFEEFVAFQEKAFEWHLRVDGFILPSVNSMLRTASGIREWYDKNKRTVQKLITIYHESIARRGELCYQELSVDELVMFIDSGTKGKSSSKRGKKRKRKPLKKTAKPVIKAPVSSPSRDVVVLKSPKEKARIIPVTEKTCEALRRIVQTSSTDPLERIAARQALLNFQDLLCLKGRFEIIGETTLGSIALDTILTLQASYYHMEQSLRLENLKQRVDRSARLAFHNLQHQATPLNKENQPIVYDLRMVNAWVPNTYRQVSEWDSLRIFRGRRPPEVLTALHEVLEDPTKTIVTNAKLKDYLQKSIFFTSDFYEDVDEVEETAASIPFSMRENPSFDTECLSISKEIINSCITNSVHPDSSPLTLTLKQVASDLNILASVISQFNKDEIPSMEFSFLVRQAFYWQGQVLEKVMQAILLKKTGQDWKKEHHLDTLYEEIFDEPSDAIKSTWWQWHNVTRYPYELGKSQSPIHSAILAAEVLREMPHLNEGFVFPNMSSPFQSEQNFIPLPKELLNTAAITKQLESVYQEFGMLLVKVLLPKF